MKDSLVKSKYKFQIIVFVQHFPQDFLQSSGYQEQRSAQLLYLSKQVLLDAGVIPAPDHESVN